MVTDKTYKERRDAWIALNGPCKKCGSKIQLEVDHIERSLKTTSNIWSKSPAVREQELQNCQVLCRSCHAEKTTAESRGSAHIDNFFNEHTVFKKNEFRCAVCSRVRNRGVFVRIEHGAREGHIIKVCKKLECAELAEDGALWVPDPLTEASAKRGKK